jgi:hypothetical protein
MEDYKAQDYIDDLYNPGYISDCCGAPIVMEDLCSRCKEHCEPIEENEEDE